MLSSVSGHYWKWRESLLERDEKEGCQQARADDGAVGE